VNYTKALSKFDIVNKEGLSVPFILNKEQQQFLDSMTGRDVILKARQIGFSSLILGIFTIDFLLKANSRGVIISHDTNSSQKLLDRAKYFLDSAQRKGLAVNLKYNNRSELINSDNNASLYIGTPQSKSFGRGDTIHSLHLSEFAFYDDPQRLLASVLQAVVPDGRVIIESTANGTNYFKQFWDLAKTKQNGFITHFFDNTHYSPEFLKQKQSELGDLYPQEYPSTDIEAFLSSGNPFFNKEALQVYLQQIAEPIATYATSYDLPLQTA
jgi:hypothetical protein